MTGTAPHLQPAGPVTGQTAALSVGTRARYMGAMLADTVGSGMYVPISLLFFHHVTGLPITRVGLLISAASVLSLIGNPVAGLLVDRFGARSVVMGVYLVRAVGFAAYPMVHNQLSMFGAVVLVALGDGAFPPSMQAFVAEVAVGANRDKLIAAQRSLRNAGLGLGGLIAGAALALSSDLAYQAIVLGSAVAFLAAALLIRTVTPQQQVERHRQPGSFSEVFRNRPFIAITLVNIPTAFGYSVLSVSLPIYLTQQLHTQPSVAGLVFAVNTVGIAALQIPVTRLLARSRRTRSAAAGGAVFSLSFLCFAALGPVPVGPVLMAGVFAATLLFTAGELLHGAAASALAASAAPQHTRGRHLAVYQLSWGIPTALAPAVLTALLARSPLAMWLVLAVGVASSATLLIRLESRLPPDSVRPGISTEPPRQPAVSTGRSNRGSGRDGSLG